MDTITINFKASGQNLTADANPQRYASNTVNYIQAVFDLDENWQSFDSVRAVWHNDFACISTVLDGNGSCTVPHEVLTNLDEVIVNLVGSDVDGEELVDRMTTYPHRVAIIDANARICGTETAEVTPSQFEQYIDIVEQIVGTVKDIDHTELTDDYCLIIYYSDGTNSGKLGPIRGATGATGNGIVSAVLNSDYTLTLTYDNGDSDTVGPIRGAQGETGNGIQSVYLTETHGAVKTYTILFTDGTTTTFDVTDGEVTLAQLESVLPTDTASGAIASFPDGTNLFTAKSLTVDINPVQDLHGYDKPWVGGSHYNQWDEVVEFGRIDTSTGALVTATDRIRSKNPIYINDNNTYYLYCGKLVGTPSSNIYAFWYGANDSYLGSTYASNTTLTPPQGAIYMRFMLGGAYGTTYLNDVSVNYPSTVTTYSPYENLCPITGWTGCNLVVSPTEDAQDGTTYPISWQTEAGTVYGGTVDVVTGVLTITKAITELDEVWTWYKSTSYPGGYYSDKRGTLGYKANTPIISSHAKTATTIEEYLFGTCYCDNSFNFRIMTEPSTVQDWRDYIIAQRTNGTPITVCYELETPQTVQLTPTEVSILLGQNNIFSCGDVAVTYKADVQRWVEKMLNA